MARGLSSLVCCGLLVVLTATTGSMAWAAEEVEAPIPVAAFAKKAVFTGLKLSPSGQYVAALIKDRRNSAVVMIDVATLKAVGRLRLDPGDHVVAFWWASDRRIVASLGTQDGPRDPPSATGEIVAVDVDGKDFRYLFGYRHTTGSRDGGQYASAQVIDPLVDDPEYILIAVREWRRGGLRYDAVYRCHVKTGALTRMVLSPEIDLSTSFFTDAAGTVRYAITTAGAFEQRTWQHLPDKNEWQQVKVAGASSPVPLGFSRNGESIFMSSREFGPRTCLVQHVIASGERRKLACDEDADLSNALFSFEADGEPIAAVFSAGKPETRLLATAHPHRALMALLIEAFPGKVVLPTSATRDGRKVLLFVYDDRSPGDYYLFDTETRKAEYFVGEREWLDPELMAERRPIKLESRDGTRLWGYLTLPRGRDPKNLPLVVNPHGGPFYVRDHWAFDEEAQLIASRGYAVLQVNFRGSGGYGSEFIVAGKKAWATTMIDDITDAVKWSIERGYVDPKRICIYGASYGGFAALTSAEREPDLYRCVVGYSGAYDLKLLKKTSDSAEGKRGRKYFVEAIAGTDEELVANSPITHLDKLKVPMLIVHGEEDERTPLSQATRLRKALEAGNHPYQWLVRPDEGHGFWQVENVTLFYDRLLAFLDQNIGSGAPSPAP